MELISKVIGFVFALGQIFHFNNLDFFDRWLGRSFSLQLGCTTVGDAQDHAVFVWEVFRSTWQASQAATSGSNLQARRQNPTLWSLARIQLYAVRVLAYGGWPCHLQSLTSITSKLQQSSKHRVKTLCCHHLKKSMVQLQGRTSMTVILNNSIDYVTTPTRIGIKQCTSLERRHIGVGHTRMLQSLHNQSRHGSCLICHWLMRHA